MTNIPETLRQASEALQQASAALVATAQAMEGAPGLEPAPEPEPGEWRNDRAPTHCDEDRDGMVWCMWGGDTMARASGTMMSNLYVMKNNTNPYWAPGNLPAPKSPPPGVVASREPELQSDTPPKPAQSRTGGWIVGRVPTQADADRGGHVLVPSRNGSRGMSFVHFLSVFPGTPWAPVNAETDPWDPTCLDRNGWIRSRLPGEGDDEGQEGWVKIPPSTVLMSKSRNANWPSFDGDDNPKMKAPPELIYELTLRAPVCRDMGVTREQWLIHAAYAAGIRHIERELLRLEVETIAKIEEVTGEAMPRWSPPNRSNCQQKNNGKSFVEKITELSPRIHEAEITEKMRRSWRVEREGGKSG